MTYFQRKVDCGENQVRPFVKSEYQYTQNFCEENIWFLGKSLLKEGFQPNHLTVLFLSNAHQQTPLYSQILGKAGLPVVWDYHVILLCMQHDNAPLIFDFDSQLPFPISLWDYLLNTFPDHQALPSQFHIYIRSIPLLSYHQCLWSDRSHMLDAQGNPVCPFPPYLPIQGEPGAFHIKLCQYIDMSKTLEDGSVVHHCEEFIRYYQEIASDSFVKDFKT